MGAAHVTATFRFCGSDFGGNARIMEQFFPCSAQSLISEDFSYLTSSIGPRRQLASVGIAFLQQ